MPIHRHEGSFAIAYHRDPEGISNEAETEYGHWLEEVRERAARVVSKGEFKYATLWKDIADAWQYIDIVSQVRAR